MFLCFCDFMQMVTFLLIQAKGVLYEVSSRAFPADGPGRRLWWE